MSNIALISLYGVENIGIRMISSVLKREHFDTSLIFFKRWLNNDIRTPSEKEKEMLIRLLKKLDTKFVGIGFTSPFLDICADITRCIKEELQVKVIWGGNHATVRPEECLKHCDLVCRGEGEGAMLELARGYALETIQNICYQKDGFVRQEPLRPLIQDLDSLPWPDYGGDNKFFIEDNRIRAFDPLERARELRIFASRGCLFKCSYCYNSIFIRLYENQKYHRIKSAENVIGEIEYALSRFRMIRKIKFDDDSFVFPKEWISEFCEKYKSRVGLPFEILFNAQSVDGDILSKLKNAGLRRVQVGIQTGSKEESRAIYHRDLGAEKIRDFARLAKAFKLDVVYDVILDNPDSDYNDKDKLIDFLLSLPRPFNLFLYSLTIFPGTQLCELLLEKGVIGPSDVEGEARKSFKQFRLNLSYPRPKDELFAACIVSLTSKSFLPKNLILVFKRNAFLKKHPLPLKIFAQSANAVKLLFVLIKMLFQGDLSFGKFREYGTSRRLLIQ